MVQLLSDDALALPGVGTTRAKKTPWHSFGGVPVAVTGRGSCLPGSADGLPGRPRPSLAAAVTARQNAAHAARRQRARAYWVARAWRVRTMAAAAVDDRPGISGARWGPVTASHDLVAWRPGQGPPTSPADQGGAGPCPRARPVRRYSSSRRPTA